MCMRWSFIASLCVMLIAFFWLICRVLLSQFFQWFDPIWILLISFGLNVHPIVYLIFKMIIVWWIGVEKWKLLFKISTKQVMIMNICMHVLKFKFVIIINLLRWKGRYNVYANILFHWGYLSEKNVNDHKSSFLLFMEISSKETWCINWTLLEW